MLRRAKTKSKKPKKPPRPLSMRDVDVALHYHFAAGQECSGAPTTYGQSSAESSSVWFSRCGVVWYHHHWYLASSRIPAPSQISRRGSAEAKNESLGKCLGYCTLELAGRPTLDFHRIFCIRSTGEQGGICNEI